MNNKSQSKKIRDVLFLLWRKDSEGFAEFEAYYQNKTQKYLDFLLKKLDDASKPKGGDVNE